jgi:hypothetical protein
MRQKRLIAALLLGCVLFGATLGAHGVSRRDSEILLSVDGPEMAMFIYLGAKHMVTGYDHLLFLAGVLFFLFRPQDVVRYVTLFTAGHSTTLLLGVLADIPANAYLVDAVIGLSVVYKAFDNLGGFEQLVGWRPDPQVAVGGFGLIHGFGLATKLQDFALPQNGLVTNIVSFNAGVEIGQLLALSAIFLGLTVWRTHAGFVRHAFAANTGLMTCGFLLAGYQLAGYLR